MNNNLLNLAIENAVICGQEFEFYSNFSGKETVKQLKEITGRKIVLCDKYHTELEDKTLIKLEPDASGGANMFELITPPLPWLESKILMIKILRWIDQNGYTTEKCAIHVNLSFNTFKLKLNNKFENLNKLKFILNMDENEIYSRFPNRKNSIYARSINFIYPINKFVFSTSMSNLGIQSFLLPQEKYFGVNFGKLDKGYFEVRYMGGKDYQKKAQDIIQVTDYITGLTYKVLQEGDNWSKKELEKLESILIANKKVIQSFSDLENFLLNYPKIAVLVDLDGNKEVLKSKWNIIRERLFELIIHSKLKEGKINYDSDISKFQLKDAKLKEAFMLKDIEMINCEISGNVERCDLYFCKIDRSHIFNSNILKGNTITNSKVIESPISNKNTIDACYIDNKNQIVNGEVTKSIIRSGVIGPTAKISEDTEKMDVIEPKQEKNKKTTK